METVWMLDDREIRVTLTENSFKRALISLNSVPENGFVMINDARFDGGEAIFIKKTRILGFRCPETAVIRYRSRYIKSEEGEDDEQEQ